LFVVAGRRFGDLLLCEPCAGKAIEEVNKSIEPLGIAPIHSGRVDLDGLVDARFPLERVADALAATRRDPALLKVMIDVESRGAEDGRD
jgi:hypothetical protein